MRWVVSTPFGCEVEPEVSRYFATVSGPTAAFSALTSPCPRKRVANSPPVEVTFSTPSNTPKASAAP